MTLLIRLILVVLVLMLAAMPAAAQDDAGEPVVVIPAPEGGVIDTALEFVLGALVGAASTLATVFGFAGRIKNDKAALDAIEWLGRSVPIEALDRLNELGRGLRDVGEVIDRVTDRLPNEVEPQAFKRTPTDGDTLGAMAAIREKITGNQ